MWRFTLLYNNTETVIDDPEGWEGISVEVERDPKWHGVFFGYPLDKLVYHGEGARIIKEEYDENGLNASMQMRVEFQCSEDGTFDEFYLGRLEFSSYEDTCGTECTVSIGLEDANDIMLLKNNFKQSVDLLNNVAFDKTTALEDYEQLNVDFELPTRSIQQRAAGYSAAGPAVVYPIELTLSSPIANSAYIRPSYTINPVEEIPTSDMLGTSIWSERNGAVYNPNQMMSFQLTLSDTQLSFTSFNYRLRLKGRIRETAPIIRPINFGLVGFKGTGFTDPQNSDTLFFDEIDTSFNVGAGSTYDKTFDVSHEGSFTMAVGDYFFASIYYAVLAGNNVVEPISQIRVDWDAETFIEITAATTFVPTTGKVWMVNEAISRACEAVTNNAIKFYSNYFGRGDSQPYSISGYPCPGLMYLSNGLNIRNKTLVDGSQSRFFVTLENLFNDLNAIWNIGMTIEPDLNREGFNRLRFEDWRYFYQDVVGINFLYAPTVKRKIDLTRCFNRFEVGYNKWEAETFTGLDEFMTKREYRLNINTIDTPFSQLSNIIASPYAIEVTRRFGTQSTDWRYDGDMFGICVTPDGDAYKTIYLTEEGAAIANIYNPETCYNQRIDPVRNAMRWFNYVMQVYRRFSSDTELIFTKGDGNYIAEYELNGACAIDAHVIRQDQNINLYDFEVAEDARPPLFPELLEFDHPMNYNMFKAIKNDPTLKYKAINVYCNGVAISAWIKSISYTPEEGQATIVAIPKNYSQLPVIPPPATCNASVLDGSVELSDFDYANKKAQIDFTEGVAGATQWTLIITRSGQPNITTVITSHPAMLSNMEPGDYTIYIVPECSPGVPGEVYPYSVTIPSPPLMITLTGQLTSQSTNRLVLGVSTNIAAIGSYSFKWGHCCVNTSSGITYCVSYPGSTFPTPENTFSITPGFTAGTQNSARTTPGSSFGYITKIVIFDMVGITSTEIQKDAGQTWTLEFV